MKAGYAVVVRSWENDVDNYKTETIDGLSEEHAKAFYNAALDLQSLHGNNWPKESVLTEILSRYQAACEKAGEAPLYYDGGDLMIALAGTPSENYDWGFLRVIEDIQVFYYPLAAQNVTSQFMNG